MYSVLVSPASASWCTTSTSSAEAAAASEATSTATTESTSRSTTTRWTSTTSRCTASSSGRTSTPSCCTKTTSTSWLLHLGRTWRGLGLGQELLERQKLVASNVELVAILERSRLDALLRLDGEEDLVEWAKDLVDFADGRLVLEVDWGVKVGDLHVDRFADHLAFGCVHE